MNLTPPAPFVPPTEETRKSPLFDDGVMIRVPVTAFGKTLYFILDSGFTVSALDARHRSSLGACLREYRTITPLGTEAALPVFPCPPLAIAGHPLPLREIACVDLTMARWISGEPCDGILGADFFAGTTLQLDFDEKSIVVGEMPAGPEGNEVPLTPIGQQYTVKARANNTQELNLLIDTGDSSSISLNPDDWSAAFPVEASSPVRATVAGLGNHVVRSKIARLHRLQIQEHTCGSLHATAIQNPASLSHLGLGFFRRYRVIFDCSRRRLYLRPGQQFSSRETEDMSGLHLLRQNDSVVVHSVDPGSPAAAQKLNAGDVVLSVNGQPAFALALRTIRQQLQSGHGNRVTLRLRQGTEFREVDLLLKRMI